MNPFWDRLRSLTGAMDPVTVALAGSVVVVAVVLLYLSKRRVEWILVGVVASAAFIGSFSATVDSVAAFVRWAGIGILTTIILVRRTPFARGSVLFFLIYAMIGFLFLYQSLDFGYQLQRGLLLIATSIAIPSTAAIIAKDGVSLKRLYLYIGIIGSLTAMMAAVQLPGHIGIAGRFTVNSMGVPAFAILLGSLLPFTFVAIWHGHNLLTRSFFILTFALGGICLLLTAQRAGTIAGLIALTPIVLGLSKSQRLWVAALIGVAAIVLVLWGGGLVDRNLEVIRNRYSLNAGMSNRDLIWADAYSRLSENFFAGRGTGAAENAFGESFHQSYLEAWFNAGPVGLLCFIAAQVRAVYVAWSLARRRGGQLKKESSLSLGIIRGFCFLSFFESTPAGASSISVILFLLTAAAMEICYQQIAPRTGDGSLKPARRRLKRAHSSSAAEVPL
jgi:O-antigen ligase